MSVPQNQTLEPLRFERHFVEKVWGGRRLEACPGIGLPAGKPIGETWEVVDREGENSVVADGPFAGTSLRDLVRERGAEILGRAPPAGGGRFPLLVKYIDASEDLSIQVHPDEESAARIGGGAEAKTEAWYVVDVAAGGAIYAGLRPEVDAARFDEIAEGPALADALLRFDVSPGECLLVPGGAVHAIGAGVTILEVQQNSDTTYRIWDWGRVGLDGKPRETHLAEARQCIRFGAELPGPIPPRWSRIDDAHERATLARSDWFAMDALRLSAAARFTAGDQFRIYAVLEGEGGLTVEGREATWTLARGDVWLVPACCESHVIEPSAGALRLVRLSHHG